MPRGHRQLDHTADLALELWAESEETLLEEGARALVEVLTGGAVFEPDAAREIRLDTVDPEDRLVQWLNEVLVLATLEGFLVTDAEIRLRDGGLEARVRGASGARSNLRTELKSVTYHDLWLERGEASCRARVVIDV